MAEENKETISGKLMRRRAVVLEDTIDKKTADEVGRRLMTLQTESSDPITLFINSEGGDPFAALELCDIMDTVMHAPVHGVAIGKCGSAATFVMLYCNRRLGTRYSRYLIHSGTRTNFKVPMDDTGPGHLLNLQEDIRSTEQMVHRLYAERLTPRIWSGERNEEVRLEFVREVIKRGDQLFNNWISAQEAIEVGLIEEIVTEKLKLFQAE